MSPLVIFSISSCIFPYILLQTFLQILLFYGPPPFLHYLTITCCTLNVHYLATSTIDGVCPVLCMYFIPQIVYLAVVCMAISSALAGVMAKLVFTYEWSWFVALMFGSIISATDPVAVVSLLNELGMFSLT